MFLTKNITDEIPEILQRKILEMNLKEGASYRPTIISPGNYVSVRSHVERRIALGILQSDMALHAMHGTREFIRVYDNTRTVCGAHRLSLQFFRRAAD